MRWRPESRSRRAEGRRHDVRTPRAVGGRRRAARPRATTASTAARCPTTRIRAARAGSRSGSPRSSPTSTAAGRCRARRTPATRPAAYAVPPVGAGRLGGVRGGRRVAADLGRRLVGERQGAHGRGRDQGDARRQDHPQRGGADRRAPRRQQDDRGLRRRTARTSSRSRSRAGTVTIKASTKVVVDAPAIELVANASHAAVFGDKLHDLPQPARAVDQHRTCTRASRPGPFPVTPTPPTPPGACRRRPDLLSTTVKVG